MDKLGCSALLCRSQWVQYKFLEFWAFFRLTFFCYFVLATLVNKHFVFANSWRVNLYFLLCTLLLLWAILNVGL